MALHLESSDYERWKSTLFNALTNAGQNQPTIPSVPLNPIQGVPVPDPRLKVINNIIKTKDHPAAVESVDIAGLVKGASKGEAWAVNFLETSELWMPFCMWFVALIEISTT